jgi:DNA-directed RNA polymerase subunit M/transcription elongation factor TFIIS
MFPMLVRFLCPACNQLLGITQRKIGAQVNCPKCGATILVPNPEEPESDQPEPEQPAQLAEQPATATIELPAGEAQMASTLPDVLADEEELPNDVGFDLLGDISLPASTSASALAEPSHTYAASVDHPHGAGKNIVISRRVVYFQAMLIALVGIIALVAGYLIGSGTRLHGP